MLSPGKVTLDVCAFSEHRIQALMLPFCEASLPNDASRRTLSVQRLYRSDLGATLARVVRDVQDQWIISIDNLTQTGFVQTSLRLISIASARSTWRHFAHLLSEELYGDPTGDSCHESPSFREKALQFVSTASVVGQRCPGTSVTESHTPQSTLNPAGAKRLAASLRGRPNRRALTCRSRCALAYQASPVQGRAGAPVHRPAAETDRIAAIGRGMGLQRATDIELQKRVGWRPSDVPTCIAGMRAAWLAS